MLVHFGPSTSPGASDPRGRPFSAKLDALVVVVQSLLVVAIYGQTRSFDFVHFDDVVYVLDNAMVRQGLSWAGVRWAFSDFYLSNWHPLTWLSHMLDVSLAGLNPGWPHLHNAMLHLANSLLVYWLLARLTLRWWPAAVGSLLFLVHPLHVESVAWIAERKDLLCAMFFLGGLLAYDSYRARSGSLRYLLVVLFQCLALMSKPMAVTFPLVLLVLDAFHYGRQGGAGCRLPPLSFLLQAVVEKVPLLLLSLAAGIVTIVAQGHGGSVASLETVSFGERLAGATVAYGIYLWQFAVPVGLTAFYPMDGASTAPLKVAVSGVALLGLLAAGWKLADEKPQFLAGVLWFLVMLLPVIGLLQVGDQAHADRYMYLPSIGLLLVTGILMPCKGSSWFRVVTLVSALVVVVFSVLCYWQVGTWEHRNALFNQVLRVHGPNYRAHYALAQDHISRQTWDQAEEHAQVAIALNGRLPFGYKALGDIALARAQFETAEHYYRLATARGEPSAYLLNNLGVAMAEQGKRDLAIQVFRRALSLEPDFFQARANLRLHLDGTGGGTY